MNFIQEVSICEGAVRRRILSECVISKKVDMLLNKSPSVYRPNA
jgi:hypothetical protein